MKPLQQIKAACLPAIFGPQLIVTTLLIGFFPPLVSAQPTSGIPVYHGSPQSVDSTGVFTNIISDFTEHTYVMPAGPIGSFADCTITRKFAAPIKSIKVTIVSGTADDIGYVGETLVTPESFGTPVCWGVGRVTNVVDVSSQVAVGANIAALKLRAQENCCCVTGWGQETDNSRSNARLHWQVELWPPVPISPALSNSVNGHFYVLLSPATWTWSERVAMSLGGHLTAIANQAEEDYVFNSFSTFGGTNRLLWIGINDVATEGHFVWSSGEPVNFTYWAPGEPNNFQGNEDFTAIYEPGHPSAGRWNDFGERVTSDNLPINGVIELVPPMGPPKITLQPRGGLVNAGTRFSFVVEATGSPPLRYQWRRNGVRIASATQSTYSLSDVQYNDSATYSVLVTNLLGSVISSEANLIVNRAPVARCLERTVSADANCMAPISIDNGSFDPDKDAITLVQSPPGPYPLGATTVTLTVADTHGLTSVCSTVVNVIDTTPPVITCPTNVITVTNAHDAWTSIVAFAPVSSDNCPGTTQVCSPASGSAFEIGAHTVTCVAMDPAGNASQCALQIMVQPGNVPPVPVIEISPLVHLPGYTNLTVIAPDGRTAAVTFDGSQSYDLDDTNFYYFWYEGTNLFSTNAIARTDLSVGLHQVMLRLDDTFPLGTNSAMVILDIISPTAAVNTMVGLVEDSNLGQKDMQPLLATLNAAVSSFDRGNSVAATNQLTALQNKIRAQIAPFDPVLADELIRTAQIIINSVHP